MPFVPAKDFKTGLSFFADFGFHAYRLGDQLASMHIGLFAFLLQRRPSDDERVAANFMMPALVEDIDAWSSRIASIDLAKRYSVKAQICWGFNDEGSWQLRSVTIVVLWHIAKDPADTDN